MAVAILIFVFSNCAHLSSTAPVDLTQSSNAIGADVVGAVFTKINDFNLFNSLESERQDVELFMREFAYVESEDGVDFPQGVRDGGIWRISRDLFNRTQNYPYPQLFDDICRALCVNWMTVRYSDLAMPLYSGLAARIHLFHLYNIDQGLPENATDTDRAIFWADAFGGNRVVSTWLSRVEQLRRVEVCQIDTDVMFVLDGSGSINESNFQTVRDYTYNYTEGLSSGGSNSRVGVILYSSTAHVQIPLEYVSTNGPKALLQEISDLPYINGYTNTPEGLCLLKNVPWRPSISVLKLAIVLTDGRSNRQSETCTTPDGGNGTVSSTASEIHNLDPPVTVLAIGVADYRLEELNIIATSEDLVDVLESFDYRLLLQNQRSRTYFICFKEFQPVTVQEEQTGEVGIGAVSRLQFTGPAGSESLSLRICVNQGVIVVYGSYTSSNPSLALHDFSKILAAPTSCLISYITLDDIEAEDKQACTTCTSRQKRFSEERNIVVYITIEGAADTSSHFSINSSIGADFECADSFCGANAVLYRGEDACFIEGDGHNCIYLDECALRNDTCDKNDNCFENYTCTCRKGYEGSEQICTREEDGDIYAIVAGVVCAVVLAVLTAV